MRIIKGYGIGFDIDDVIKSLNLDFNDLRTIYHILVPDQFSQEIENYILNKTKNKSYMNIHVESFSSLCREVLTDTFNFKTLLTELNQEMIIRKVLIDNNKRLKVLRNKYNNAGFIDELLGLFNDISSSGTKDFGLEIGSEGVSENLKNKMGDINILYNDYLSKTSKNHLVGNILQNSKQYIADWYACRKKICRNDKFIFIGFNDLSKAQLSFIEEILKTFDDVTFYFNVGHDNLDGASTFSITEETIKEIVSIAKKYNIDFDIKKLNIVSNNFFKYLSLNLYDKVDYKYNFKSVPLEITECPNIKFELSYICNKINEYIKNGYRYDDIVILIGDLESNLNLIRKIFSDNNIPIYLDIKSKLKTSPLYRLLLSIYKIVSNGMNPNNVIELIKFGYFYKDITTVSLIENFILKYGFKKLKDYQCIKLNENEPNYIQINTALQFLIEILQTLDILSKKKTEYKEGINIFRRLLQRFNIEDCLKDTIDQINIDGKVHLAEQYDQLYSLLDDALKALEDGYDDNEFDKNEISATVWLRLLINYFYDLKLPTTPAKVNEVLIGSVSRTMFLSKKIGFIVQANSGLLINGNDKDYIFNEIEKNELILQNIDLRKTVFNIDSLNRCKLLNGIERFQEKLYISFSNYSISGEELSRDTIIDTIMQDDNIRNNIKINKYKNIQYSNLNSVSQVYEYISSQNINENALINLLESIEKYTIFYQAKSLIYAIKQNNKVKINENNKFIINNKTNYSISQIERYNRCPYSYFINYMLRLKERDEYKLNNLDTGSLYHLFLEKFVRENDILSIVDSEEKINNLFSEYIDSYINEKESYKFTYNYTNRAILDRMRSKLVENAINIAKEVNILGADILYQEKKFNYVDNGISYTGIIDRLDEVKESYVRLYDYKSTKGEFKKDEIELGIKLQLLFYAKLQQLSGKIPYYIEYRSLKNKIYDKDNNPLGVKDNIIYMENIDDDSIEKLKEDKHKKFNKLSKEDFQEQLDYSYEKVTDTVVNIKSGEFDILPYKIGSRNACQYCEYMNICGFDETDYRKYCYRTRNNDE